jgi:hypothetical protein
MSMPERDFFPGCSGPCGHLLSQACQSDLSVHLTHAKDPLIRPKLGFLLNFHGDVGQ